MTTISAARAACRGVACRVDARHHSPNVAAQRGGVAGDNATYYSGLRHKYLSLYVGNANYYVHIIGLTGD